MIQDDDCQVEKPAVGHTVESAAAKIHIAIFADKNSYEAARMEREDRFFLSRGLLFAELESGDRNIDDRCEPQKSGPRQARATTVYNGIDEAIILRANEHYCQRDVDKNGQANHEIPRAVSGLSLALSERAV